MYTTLNILTAFLWYSAAAWSIDAIYVEGQGGLLPIFVLLGSGVLAGMQSIDLIRDLKDKHNQGEL